MMKRLTIALLFLFTGSAYAANYVPLTPGDATYGVSGQYGFSRTHYITPLGVWFSFFTNDYNNNSNRFLDIRKKTGSNWGTYYLATTSDTATRPNVRDNYVSFYVPRLNQIWITGGSHLEEWDRTHPSALAISSGRLNLAGCKANALVADCAVWINPESGRNLVNTFLNPSASNNNCGAFVGIIKNCLFDNPNNHGADPGAAWSDTLDMGVIYGGTDKPTTTTVIVRNLNNNLCQPGGTATGAEEYIMCNLAENPRSPLTNEWMNCGINATTANQIVSPNPTGTTPYRHSQAMNILVKGDGNNFYLAGTYAYSLGGENCVRTLWRFNGATGAWTKLTSPPTIGYTPAMTYDSVRNKLILNVGLKEANAVNIYEYNITTDTWTDITPAGSVCTYNQAASYIPAADLVIWQGGNLCQSTGYITSTATLGFNYPGGFYIPPRTWVAMPYSGVPTTAPGNYGGTAGGKHMNFAVNGTGKIYITGGDSFGTSAVGDNMGVWTYNPNGNIWNQEYTNCGSFGDILPGGANESGFVWDSARSKFWLMRGFWFLQQSGPSGCGTTVTWNTASPLVITGKVYLAINLATGDRWYEPTDPDGATSNFTISKTNVGGANEQQTLTKNSSLGTAGGAMPASVTVWYQPPTAGYQSRIKNLTFSTSTNKWSDPNMACEPLGSPQCTAQLPKNAVYDPVGDAIWRVGSDFRGVIWTKYTPSNNTWLVFSTPCATGRVNGVQGNCFSGETYINGTDVQFEWLTIDPVGRKIYVMDPYNYELWEFSLVTQRVTIRAPVPKTVLTANPPCSGSAVISAFDSQQPWWDSVNGKLLHPWLGCLNQSRPKLLIWDPANPTTFEVDPMFQPEGKTVRGNMSVFEPVNNVLMTYGGLCWGTLPNCSGPAGANDGNPDPTLTDFYLYRYGPTIIAGAAPPPDTVPPVVNITAPTSNPTYSTNSNSINLAGTATDDTAVTAITWANDRGGSGNAAVASGWNINGITLQLGVNVITVSAFDAAANTGTDTITVTYTVSGPTAGIKLNAGGTIGLKLGESVGVKVAP